MGVYVKDTWMGGVKCEDVRELFQGGGAGCYPLGLKDVVREPLRWQESEGFPTQGRLPA